MTIGALRVNLALLLVSLAVFHSEQASAQACSKSVPLANEQRIVATNGAISLLTKFVGKISGGVDYSSTRTEILSRYPNADQALFNAQYFVFACHWIERDKSLSPMQKIAALNQARLQILGLPAGLPAPIVQASPRLSATVASPSKLGATTVATVPAARRDRAAWATRYIHPAPSLPNQYNSAFVIVASPTSEAEGRRKIDELRRKHPDLDFELYPPYRENPHYGVMLATFASNSEAQSALQVAKRRIDAGSYIWWLPVAR